MKSNGLGESLASDARSVWALWRGLPSGYRACASLRLWLYGFGPGDVAEIPATSPVSLALRGLRA
ncbi:MAG: hypothetical protein Q8Q09_04905 [Deltaproteobacteria bacterium]|nr:hypothetical protein [Deltaproteobacteria bacterium]